VGTASATVRTADSYDGARKGDIDIRPVSQDQLFLNGQPTGDRIEPPIANAPAAKH